MPSFYRLNEYQHLAQREIFIDANVLIYLFWPTGRINFEQTYATVFRNLLRQGNNLYVDFLVLSEVINRAIRTEYEKFLISNGYAKSQIKFKDFRDRDEGKEAVKDIYLLVRENILNKLNVTGKAFNHQDIESFLQHDSLDFVDKAIENVCADNDFVLLTNDKDFKYCGLDILSGNLGYFR